MIAQTKSAFKRGTADGANLPESNMSQFATHFPSLGEFPDFCDISRDIDPFGCSSPPVGHRCLRRRLRMDTVYTVRVVAEASSISAYQHPAGQLQKKFVYWGCINGSTSSKFCEHGCVGVSGWCTCLLLQAACAFLTPMTRQGITYEKETKKKPGDPGYEMVSRDRTNIGQSQSLYDQLQARKEEAEAAAIEREKLRYMPPAALDEEDAKFLTEHEDARRARDADEKRRAEEDREQFAKALATRTISSATDAQTTTAKSKSKASGKPHKAMCPECSDVWL